MFSADTEMGLLPNVPMNLVHPAGEVRREKSLVGQVWGPNAIASKVLGGYAPRRRGPFLRSGRSSGCSSSKRRPT